MDFWKKYNWIGYVLVVLITLMAFAMNIISASEQTHTPNDSVAETDKSTRAESNNTSPTPIENNSESSQYNLN